MDQFDTVPVLRLHLEEFQKTLTFVEGLLVAQDLQREYAAMANTTRPSRLTQDVQRQLERLNGYLQENDELPEG